MMCTSMTSVTLPSDIRVAQEPTFSASIIKVHCSYFEVNNLVLKSLQEFWRVFVTGGGRVVLKGACVHELIKMQ